MRKVVQDIIMFVINSVQVLLFDVLWFGQDIILNSVSPSLDFFVDLGHGEEFQKILRVLLFYLLIHAVRTKASHLL